MNRNSITPAMFAFAMFFSTPLFAAEANPDSRVRDLYHHLGLVSEGSPSIEQLERTLFGQEFSGEPATRLSTVEKILQGSPGGSKPALLARLHLAEWRKSQKIQPQLPALQRVSELEGAYAIPAGAAEPLAFRIEYLSRVAGISDGWNSTTLSETKNIKIVLKQVIDSRRAKNGDKFTYALADDLMIGDILIAPRGTIGSGRVIKARRGGKFGVSGVLKLDLGFLEGLDGTKIKLQGQDHGYQAKKSIPQALTASFVGFLTLGPVGGLGGVLVQGKNISLAENSELTATLAPSGPFNGFKP